MAEQGQELKGASGLQVIHFGKTPQLPVTPSTLTILVDTTE